MKKLYEMITAENWTKHDYGIGSKKKCLSGHSISMNDGIDVHNKRMSAVAKIISVVFPERGYGLNCNSLTVMVFNDKTDTTVEDIIRVCKMADV